MKKENRLIVTFHTTADAIAFERACKRDHIAGRMIPVPRELSAGCGLSWMTDPGERAVMEEVLRKENIGAEAVTEVVC